MDQEGFSSGGRFFTQYIRCRQALLVIVKNTIALSLLGLAK